MRAIPRSIFLRAEAAQVSLVRATFNEKVAEQMSKQVTAKQVIVVR